MKKLLAFVFVFVIWVSTCVYAARYATEPPTGWKVSNLTMSSTTEVYLLTFEANAIEVHLVAKGADVKWLETNIITGEYTTLKQDIEFVNQFPIYVSKESCWWFNATTTNKSTIEARYGYY